MSPYVPTKNLLADRVILVTGAAAGIGRAAALAFAQHGATLVLLDRQEKALEQTYDAIEQAGGAQPAIITLDLAKASLEHYQALQQQLEQELGRLDGLLHNAAELGELAPRCFSAWRTRFFACAVLATVTSRTRNRRRATMRI